MKKVAIYCRVSTLEQAEHGYSISEQVDKLKKYCDIHDYSIYKEYIDGGYSGAKLDRPAMQEMINDSKKRKFEAVIVYKLDRLSRNLQNALYLIKDVFKDNNISFASLNENIDLSTAAGELNFNMFASFAEFERANIKDRMMMGAYARAKSGKCASPSRTPFGYDYDNGILKKNALTSPIVKDIFDKYQSGLSIAKILISLNEDGYVGKDKPWRSAGIFRIIRNKTYAGYIKYKGEHFVGLHDGIVSEKQFNEVQKQIEIRQNKSYREGNATRPFQSKYMLSGLVFCGTCGQKLAVIQYGKKDGIYTSKKYKCVGKQAYYKKMNGASASPIFCESPNYDFDELEKRVITQIKKISFKFNGAKSKTETPSDNELLKSEIEKIDSSLSKLVDLYINDNIDLDIYEDRKQKLDDKLKKLKSALNKKDDKNLITQEEAYKMLKSSNLDSMPYDSKKTLVNKLIKKIDVFTDEVMIHLNF